jgi:1-acyl-sn-glycerol-3-phosphate acyltransferase
MLEASKEEAILKDQTEPIELDPPPSIRNYIFSAWIYGSVTFCLSIAWLISVFVSSELARRKIAKAAAIISLKVAGISIRRSKLAEIPEQCIYVGNHCSYLDVLVVYSSLPTSFRFVAKRELKNVPAMGFFFRRLGTQFIDRTDAREAKNALSKMEEVLKTTDSLFFFAEGTFFASPGVLAFKSGAFNLAAKHALPIVPVSLNGTRTMLRDGRWWFRDVLIELKIHPMTQIVTAENLGQIKQETRALIGIEINEPLL